MNPNEELELIKEAIREILADLQEMMQEGEILSDELQDSVANLLDRAAARIVELQKELSQEPVEALTPQVPQLDQGPFPSSNVNSFKYNPKTGQLFVKFHGAESAESGPTYSYKGVPKNTYDIFAQGRVAPKTSGQNQYHRWIKGVTPSLGASLNALIKNGGFSYQRVS